MSDRVKGATNIYLCYLRDMGTCICFCILWAKDVKNPLGITELNLEEVNIYELSLKDLDLSWDSNMYFLARPS